MADQDRNQEGGREERKPYRGGAAGGKSFGGRGGGSGDGGKFSGRNDSKPGASRDERGGGFARDGQSERRAGENPAGRGYSAGREQSPRGGSGSAGGRQGYAGSSSPRRTNDAPRGSGAGTGSGRGSYGGRQGAGSSSREGGDRSRGAGGSWQDRTPRSEGDRQERPAQPRPHNARDLRSANRPDRERSPEIDEDVTGAELDRVTRAQVRNLEERSAEWVARHLVMAGRLLDDEPELAFQHALAASRRGGRLAAVREAVGLTAYAAGHYGEALREFRTFRRISGSNDHLPVMADCERGLGRPDRALDLARTDEASTLDTAGKVELAIVVSGARTDMGEKDAAVAALEIPQLNMNRAFSYSPRLFRAYADALDAVERPEDAATWRRQALLADSALGTGSFAEPEIIDLVDDDDEPAEKAPRRKPEYTRADAPANINPAVDVETGGNVEDSTPEDSTPEDSTPDDAAPVDGENPRGE
ncbi:hypothetical protein [Arthrobacter sp. H5]|uniref:hypothetical protein n=1 Tax=Arthrobacter sp. H5 TaxID=1267973 RepID=UPI0020A6594F|nr:hypothetical protein [Arthrobacter sp. H5]